MSSAQPLTAPAPPKRPRRWIWRTLLAIAVLIVVGGGLFWWRLESAHWSTAAVLAETDALDPGWRIDDVMKQRRRVADADNSALLIDAARMAGYVSVYSAPNHDTIMEGWKAPLPLNHAQRELLRSELAKMPKAVALARQIKDRPYGSFPLTLSPDYISTLVPHVQTVRETMVVLQFDAWLRADSESVAASLESCQALLNTGRSLADEPFLISQLVRYAGQAILLDVLEKCLAQGEATPVPLAALQDSLAREIRESDWLFALRGERAGGILFLENAESSPVKFRQLKQIMGVRNGPTKFQLSDYVFDYLPASLKMQIPQHLRYMNRIIEAAKLPLHEQTVALAKIEADLPQQPAINQALAPGKKMGGAHLRSQAGLRTMLVALACERYRMQHKTWPDSLEKLVEAKLLDAVPADPFDGKPLRMTRTKWGVVLYSVGHDNVDDGGAIDRERPIDPGVDLGVRLWDLSRRKGGVP